MQPQPSYSHHVKSCIKNLAIARSACFLAIDELEKLGFLDVPMLDDNGNLVDYDLEQVIFSSIDLIFSNWTEDRQIDDEGISLFLQDCINHGHGLIKKQNHLSESQ